jgi:hypothetical protein
LRAWLTPVKLAEGGVFNLAAVLLGADFDGTLRSSGLRALCAQCRPVAERLLPKGTAKSGQAVSGLWQYESLGRESRSVMRMLEFTMAGNDVARFCGDLGTAATGCLNVPQAVDDNGIRAARYHHRSWRYHCGPRW